MFQRFSQRLGQLRTLGHRPAVGSGVEHLAGGLQGAAAGLDGESGHRRIGRHRVDLTGDQGGGQVVLSREYHAVDRRQSGGDTLRALARQLVGLLDDAGAHPHPQTAGLRRVDRRTGPLGPQRSRLEVGDEVGLLLAFTGVGHRGHADVEVAGSDRGHNGVEVDLPVVHRNAQHPRYGVHQIDVESHQLSVAVPEFVWRVRKIDTHHQPPGGPDAVGQGGRDRRDGTRVHLVGGTRPRVGVTLRQ